MRDAIKPLADELASRSLSLLIVETLFFSIINIAAFLGNMFVLLAVYRTNRPRSINVLVAALAIGDILMSLFCMPLSVTTLARGEWFFGKHVCRVHGFVVLTLAQSSLHIMGLISLSRYFCVVRRSKFDVLFTKRRTILYVAIVWCFGLGITVAPFFFHLGFEFQPGKAMCLYVFEAVIGYTAFLYSVTFLLPLFLIIVCYAMIFRQVSRTNRVLSLQNNLAGLRGSVEEAKVTKTVATVMVGFSFCWLPIGVIDFIDTGHGKPTLTRQVYLMYAALIYLSSTINPFIYSVTDKRFRRELYRCVRCIFCFKAAEGMNEPQANEN